MWWYAIYFKTVPRGCIFFKMAVVFAIFKNIQCRTQSFLGIPIFENVNFYTTSPSLTLHLMREQLWPYKVYVFCKHNK